jgi:hypothetical protein
MSATYSTDMMSSCANCGKGEEDSNKLKKCSACLSVKYCSAACQKAHRPQHKKACKKRASELHDEKLFKDPPPTEECPICLLLPDPNEERQPSFHPCCGKIICHGCIYAMQISAGKYLCPFCREPNANSNDEHIERTKKLMEKGDAEAFVFLAFSYDTGNNGLPQDMAKAKELYLKAGELGSSEAYSNLGIAYDQGRGVEVDKKKAKYYYEHAAIGGDIHARHNLAGLEVSAGNIERALKHFIMAAKAGDEKSLGAIKAGFMEGLVSKETVYASTLRAYHEIKKEMKSDMRDKAAAYYRHLS